VNREAFQLLLAQFQPTCSAWSRSICSMTCRSRRSGVKVCSWLTDLASSVGDNRPVVLAPREGEQLQAEFPQFFFDRFRGMPGQLPDAKDPYPLENFFRGLAHAPQLGDGRFSRKEPTSSGLISTRPSGFFQSEAILARNLLGAIPAEAVSPVRVRIFFLIARAISGAGQRGIHSR